MREPLVIQKLKRLASLVSCVDITYQHQYGNFSVYDSGSGTSFSYPKTYKELLEDLDNRIVEVETTNAK